jgi:hypothetical protein
VLFRSHTSKGKLAFKTLVLSLIIIATASSQKIYSAADAQNHVGEYATVIGKVYQVFTSKKGTTFLDIGGNYPNNPFTAVIFYRDSPKFAAVLGFKGKTLRITGKIKSYEGTPEIILNDESQIEIVGAKSGNNEKPINPKD